jgi:hypothetical protein
VVLIVDGGSCAERLASGEPSQQAAQEPPCQELRERPGAWSPSVAPRIHRAVLDRLGKQGELD